MPRRKENIEPKQEDPRISASRILLARAAYAASVPLPSKAVEHRDARQAIEPQPQLQPRHEERCRQYIGVQQTPVSGPITFESVQRSCTAVTRHEKDEVSASCPPPREPPQPTTAPSRAQQEAAHRRSAAWQAHGVCEALAVPQQGAAGGDTNSEGHSDAAAAPPADWLLSIVQTALQEAADT